MRSTTTRICEHRSDMFNANGAFLILTAEDMLSVRLQLSDSYSEADITRENIFRALEDRHIVYTEEDIQRIDRSVAAIRENPDYDEEPIIVQGVAPIHGINGRIIDCLDPNERARTKAGGTDHYKRNTLRAVDPGDVVLRIIKPTPHTDGRDVYGRVVPAQKGEMPPLVLSENLKKSDDGLQVEATASGTFDFENGYAALTPNLHITSDIDFRTGSVDFEGEVDIAKDVADRFHIKTSKSVNIKGVAEGAQIEALLDVTISGGIYGKSKGFYKSGRSFFTKFASDARIVAAGDITVNEFCQNSNIRCGGKLLMPSGMLRGGELRCRKGAEIGQIGADKSGRTSIWVGVHENLPEQLQYIDEQIKGIMRRITELKEEYIELAAKTDTTSAEENERMARITESIQSSVAQLKDRRDMLHKMREDQENNEHVSIEVNKKTCPGAVIHFYGAVATIRETIEGRHNISVRRTPDGTKIILKKTGSAEETELPCEPYFPKSELDKDAKAA